MAINPADFPGLWGPVPEPGSKPGTEKEQEVSRTPNSSLDKNAFLNLLVTQMKYQDPLNPVDDKQFLAQMAQFTSLEQMQNMNATTSKSQAYSMMGKEIYAEKYNTKTYQVDVVEGRVAAVTLKSGSPYLLVITEDSEYPVEVPLEDVVEVYESADAGQMKGIYDSLSVSQNMALIGKFVQAVSQDADGKPIFVEGEVESVKFFNNQAVLVVGDKQVFGKEIMSVSEKMELIGSFVTVTKKDEATGEYSDYITKGEISGVKFTGDNGKDIYVTVDGAGIKVSSVNELIYLTEANGYIGKDLKDGSVKGKVTDFVIRDSKVHLKVLTDADKDEYGYVEFTKVRGKI